MMHQVVDAILDGASAHAQDGPPHEGRLAATLHASQSGEHRAVAVDLPRTGLVKDERWSP
jgi:hypothetical protein